MGHILCLLKVVVVNKTSKALIILFVLLISLSCVNASEINIRSLDNKNIDATVNESHMTFDTDYLNISIEHIDFCVPSGLKDDLAYVTGCDPNTMTCQGPNDYFHILNDPTNEYSDRFYIETDYIFDYDMNDGDNDIPDGFNWNRMNYEIRVNYSTGNQGVLS